MIIGMASKYDKKAGMGTVISMTIPYSVAFLISWVIMVIIWMMFGLPLGPGASVFY
jgi:aminobenzoyl-glutamate transport protein